MNRPVTTSEVRRHELKTRGGRLVSALTSLALVLSVCVGVAVAGVVAASSASATPAAPAQRSSTNVTADALPTVQIDGVVWSQAVVGNNVYAGGSFANARPAGAAPGTNLTPRANLLSYNITTGALNTSFAPSLNGAVKVVTASPDGTRIYVGGSFTQANGQDRYRIAAYSTSTGQLISTFQPVLDYDVNAIVATNTTVYVGGGFSSANNVARAHLAAFSASDGSLLAWAPTADNHEVESMVMAPGGSKIIVGGSFTSLDGSSNGYGLGALDATTGALLSWSATSVIKDAGDNGAVLSLTTDGKSIFATGYSYGSGANFEGTASMDPSTGAINWLEDCHGDTYDAFPVNGTVYTVGHSHYCGNMGDYPQPATWQYHHAQAFTDKASGTLLHDSVGYPDFGGEPSPAMVNWFPDMDPGTYTGQSQAAWSVSGNASYVVLGGEFPTVNGAPQQGLVRFGVPSVAPKKQGPMLSGSDFEPTLRPVSSTSVRISWPANWDRDDQNLTYHVVRNGDTDHPIYTTTATSQFWNRPTMGYVDTGLTPGTSYDYRLNVTDPDGNLVWGDTVSITTPTTSPSSYAQQILTDNAASYWRLDQTSGNTSADSAGADNLTDGIGVVGGAASAILGDSDTAANFNGASSGTAYTANAEPAPNTYSLEAWFNTTTRTGGKIIGFGNSQGSSTVVDRQIYMDNSGHLVYGVWQDTNNVVTTPNTYNDGKWHQVVATLSSAGMVLYVDGQQVGANSAVTIGRPYYGYWRVGGDSLSGWPSAPTSGYFKGALDEVAVYPAALSLATVQHHYALSGRTPPNNAPTAAFTASCSGLTCALNGSSSTDSDGSVASYAWNFGDGATGTGATPSHTYAAAGTYSVTLTVTDNQGATNSVTHTVTVTAPNKAPTAAFTSSCTGMTCSLNGSSSTDSDGSIASYAWQFGDGATGTGASPSHTYAKAGSYSVTLTVTDNQGATNSVTHTVTVTATATNKAPTAAFTSSCSGLTCALNGSSSTDSDGTVASYAWNFGDSASGTGATPSHTYAKAGSYSVTLTVTDNQGATNSVTHTVTVTAPANVAPTAAFSSSCSGLTCALNGSSSTDPDGSVASYAWNFGDGATGTGATPSHTYAAAGTYSVTLTVTDNQGATNSVTHSVTVTSPTTGKLTAAFTASCSGLTCSFDGSSSTAPSGSTIRRYEWYYGDRRSGKGVQASHTYSFAGTYPVYLTVTDNHGRTATTNQRVTVTAPARHKARPAVISDQFQRSVQQGWGTATKGGKWTAGPSSAFAVTGGRAIVRLSKPGARPTAALDGVSRENLNLTFDSGLNKAATGKGVQVAVLLRKTTSGEYRFKVLYLPHGVVHLVVSKAVGGKETVLREVAVSGLQYRPGTMLRALVHISGTSPTSVAARVWQVGGVKPKAPQLTVSDSQSALQRAGSVAVRAVLSRSATMSPVVGYVDNLTATAG